MSNSCEMAAMRALIFALLLNAGAPGQAGLLTGTVVDPSGAPIPNATVRLDVSGTTMAEADTGSDGRFNADGQRSGRGAHRRDRRWLRASGRASVGQ